MKIDPHHHKEKYLAWKEKINGRIPEVSQENSDFLVNYIFDMEKILSFILKCALTQAISS